VKVLIKRKRRMKVNSTREMISYPRTREEKRVKGIEAISNTIKALIDILNRTLNVRRIESSNYSRDK